MSAQTSGECSPAYWEKLDDASLKREIDRLSKELAEPSEAISSESPKGQVCKTATEAARVLGVSSKTFAEWRQHEDFPGVPGTQNGRNAYWPIDEIKAWRSAKFGGRTADEPGDLKRRRLLADVETREAKLRKILGVSIDLELAEALFVQAFNAARSKLEDIPDRIVAKIPATKPKLRRRVALVAQRVVRATLVELSDLTLSLIDNEDDVDDLERGANQTHGRQRGSKATAARDRGRVAGGRKAKARRVGAKGGAA